MLFFFGSRSRMGSCSHSCIVVHCLGCILVHSKRIFPEAIQMHVLFACALSGWTWMCPFLFALAVQSSQTNPWIKSVPLSCDSFFCSKCHDRACMLLDCLRRHTAHTHTHLPFQMAAFDVALAIALPLLRRLKHTYNHHMQAWNTSATRYIIIPLLGRHMKPIHRAAHMQSAVRRCLCQRALLWQLDHALPNQYLQHGHARVSRASLIAERLQKHCSAIKNKA